MTDTGTQIQALPVKREIIKSRMLMLKLITMPARMLTMTPVIFAIVMCICNVHIWDVPEVSVISLMCMNPYQIR